jgi:hypothetical protein
VLASNEHCAIQALRVGRWAWGVQFHLEVGRDTVPEWSLVPEYRATLESLGHGDADWLGAAVTPHLPTMRNNTDRLLSAILTTVQEYQPDVAPEPSGPSRDRPPLRRGCPGARRRRRPHRRVVAGAGIDNVHVALLDPSGTLREKRLGRRAAARAFERGWSFIDAIGWWGPDDGVWRAGGSEHQPARLDTGAVDEIPSRRTR